MTCPKCLANSFPLSKIANHPLDSLCTCPECRAQFIPALIVFFNRGYDAALKAQQPTTGASTPLKCSCGKVAVVCQDCFDNKKEDGF